MNERIDPQGLAGTGRGASANPILIDNSLSILNRTGAYYIARDLCQEFVPGDARVRYWRLGSVSPEGVARKIAARLMALELDWLGDSELFLIGDRIEGSGFRLFLDPLYVLRSRLGENDVVLCHDIGPLTHTWLYGRRNCANYRLAYEKIRRARPGIVFVSNFSANHFKALFGTGFRFLKTIPLYLRTGLSGGEAVTVPGVDGPFLLTVGAFEIRKNQVTALKAYRDGGFHARGVGYVLCGSPGDNHAEIAALAGSIPGVRLMGYVPDAQLRWLYANAEAFVLPSHLEGFGMPALEAAHMGLLPIVSADSALVEAVGGACFQVRPESPSSIAGAMLEAISRSREEKAETSRSLRGIASVATKERYLQQWRELLAGQQ